MTLTPRPGGTTVLPHGVTVARLGVGCWPIGGPAHNLGMPMGWSTADDTEARAGLDRAFALGANLFDTADVYGLGHSEELIGQFLRTVPRADVAVSSKVGYWDPGSAAPSAYEPTYMRAQLERTLDRLGTDYLDVYALHNGNFGPDDHYLEGAVEVMRALQSEGLVRAVGMRGPHRYAPERLAAPTGTRENKHDRFRRQFDVVKPDVLAVRDNLLTPPQHTAGIRQFAAERGVTVMVNKSLGQGLLTGKHSADAPPVFASGDHRTRKAWFSAPALAVLDEHLTPVRARFGPARTGLVHAALRWLLTQWPGAVVLTGFTTAEQIAMNLSTPAEPLSPEDAAFLAAAGRSAQQALDELGEVFADEQ